jgi:hypothetical protein
MKTSAATTMVRGTDNNQLKGAAEETTMAEIATAMERPMVTATIRMLASPPMMVH